MKFNTDNLVIKSISYFFLLILITMVMSCSPDESDELEIKKVLKVTSTSPSEINPTSSTLNGKIEEIGSTNITDHGFTISQTTTFEENSTTMHSLGVKSEIGNFSILIEGLSPETTYYYKAYAEDIDGVVYGSSISLITNSPIILAVDPSQGIAGEEVIISGVNFVNGMKFKFGDIEAVVIEITSTTARVIVPNDLGITPLNLVTVVGQSIYTSSIEFLPLYGKWEEVASFPGVGRNFAINFTINGKGYVGLGFSNGQYHNDMWVYDPNNDSWTQLKDFPVVINSTFRVSFAIGGVGYAGISDEENQFWKYDATDDLWLRIADFPGAPLGYSMNSFVIDGKGFVGKGIGGSTNVEFWMYDPLNNSWALESIFPNIWPNLSFHVSSVTAGYMGLGSNLKQLWQYTPLTKIWKQMVDFPAANSSNIWSTSFNINGIIYAGISDGGTGIGWDTNFWQYDESLDSWIQLSNFPFVPTGGGINMVINSNAYIGLGDNGSLNSIYKFTPPQ